MPLPHIGDSEPDHCSVGSDMEMLFGSATVYTWEWRKELNLTDAVLGLVALLGLHGVGRLAEVPAEVELLRRWKRSLQRHDGARCPADEREEAVAHGVAPAEPGWAERGLVSEREVGGAVLVELLGAFGDRLAPGLRLSSGFPA